MLNFGIEFLSEKPKDCYSPESPKDGKVLKASVLHGEKVQYQCNQGYIMKGQNGQECNNGIFTGTIPSCEKGNRQLH